MRLIDADELKYRTDKTGFGYIMAWEVHGTPTVPAIPVKWIENYIKRYYGTGDLVYPEGFLKELVTWWRYDENEYKENTSQTD